MKRLQTKKSLIKCHPRFFFHRRVKLFEHKKRKKGTKYVLGKFFLLEYTKAVAHRCSVKKVFLEISQNSQENICARVYFLIKFPVVCFAAP